LLAWHVRVDKRNNPKSQCRAFSEVQMRHSATAAGNSASPTRNNVSFTAEYSWLQFASRYRARADAPSEQKQR